MKLGSSCRNSNMFTPPMYANVLKLEKSRLGSKSTFILAIANGARISVNMNRQIDTATSFRCRWFLPFSDSLISCSVKSIFKQTQVPTEHEYAQRSRLTIGKNDSQC